MRRLKTVRRPPIYPKSPGHLPCSSLTHPLPLPSRRPSVSFGEFGLRPLIQDKTPTRGSRDVVIRCTSSYRNSCMHARLLSAHPAGRNHGALLGQALPVLAWSTSLAERKSTPISPQPLYLRPWGPSEQDLRQAEQGVGDRTASDPKTLCSVVARDRLGRVPNREADV